MFSKCYFDVDIMRDIVKYFQPISIQKQKFGCALKHTSTSTLAPTITAFTFERNGGGGGIMNGPAIS